VFITRAASTLVGVALALGAVVAPAQAAQTPPPGAQPMIIGGGDATETHGSVRLDKDGDAQCTATIIDPDWVLTAKHCVKDVDNDDADEKLSFKIGDVDADKGEEVRAKENGIHQHDHADLALVRLDHSVRTDYAQLGNKLAVGGLNNRTAQIYGWGMTCPFFFPGFVCKPDVLKTAKVDITDGEQCKDLEGGRALCASFGDGLAAKGDSGGPMFVTGLNGKSYQVGVSSKGDMNSQAWYTNILEYKDWIEDVTDD
jgi:secreted trypsin-like serine protease